jgi:hypothetical protein
MKLFCSFIVVIALQATSLTLLAQDSLIAKIVNQSQSTFSFKTNTFRGIGWDTLVSQIQKSDFVFIGEDHFTNEIPLFTSAIATKVEFDNFFIETDPYSAKIIESKIKTLGDLNFKKYQDEFEEVFSFYGLEPESQLFKQLVKSNTVIYGTDQILMNADRLICNDLKNKTKNKKAKKIYEDIEAKSKVHFADFLKDPSKPMYLMTEEFEKQLQELKTLRLSQEEIEIINDLQLTAKIYKEQNHHLRIQLMKNNLMKVYPKWHNKKNLFKYGAIHISKGESFFKIYDIGNLVNNIADSEFKNSLHIMIVGKSGMQGSPFKGFPANAVDENSDILKFLKPLFSVVTSEDWHCFDLRQLRDAKEKGKVEVKDITLSRTIDGYDYVIIIPKVTAAKFPKTE